MQFKDEDPLVALRAALSIIDSQLYLSEITVRQLESLHKDLGEAAYTPLHGHQGLRADPIKSLLLMKAAEHLALAKRVATLRRVAAALQEHDNKNKPP